MCVSVRGRGCVHQQRVRRGGALWEVAGRKQLERRRSSSRSRSCPAFSQSQSTELIEFAFHIHLKFGCVAFCRLVVRIPSQQRGVDQIGFLLNLQLARHRPTFTEGISLLGIVPIINFVLWSQPLRATENNSSGVLSAGQAAALWLRKFIRWLFCGTKECF